MNEELDQGPKPTGETTITDQIPPFPQRRVERCDRAECTMQIVGY